MRRLCLAVLFCVMFVSGARADLHGMFIRVECNRDLGVLDIFYDYIFGDKVGLFFDQGMNDYVYHIKQGESSNADLTLINGYYFKEPYQFHCELAPHQKFDVTIKRDDSGRYINEGSFFVTVVEHLEDFETKKVVEKTLVDNVIIGAGGQIERIKIAAKDDNKGTDITLARSQFVAYFMEPERDKPLTEEVIKAEREDLERRAKKLEYEEAQEGYCEKHSCGVDIEDMPSVEKLSEILQEVLAEDAAKKAETEAENKGSVGLKY